MQRQYETVIIVTPVLSEEDLKKTYDNYIAFLKKNKAEIIHEEKWGLKQLAYPIKKKTTGYYYLFEYKAEPEVIALLEKEFSRDESIMRFLTTKLDKYAIDYNDRKRKGLIGKGKPDNKDDKADKVEEKEEVKGKIEEKIVKADDSNKEAATLKEEKSVVDAKTEPTEASSDKGPKEDTSSTPEDAATKEKDAPLKEVDAKEADTKETDAKETETPPVEDSASEEEKEETIDSKEKQDS